MVARERVSAVGLRWRCHLATNAVPGPRGGRWRTKLVREEPRLVQLLRLLGFGAGLMVILAGYQYEGAIFGLSAL